MTVERVPVGTSGRYGNWGVILRSLTEEEELKLTPDNGKSVNALRVMAIVAAKKLGVNIGTRVKDGSAYVYLKEKK